MHADICGRGILIVFQRIRKEKIFLLLEVNNILCHYAELTLKTKKLLLFLSFFRSQPILEDSSGKSGAKFYQSYDKLFIIKTLTREEVERMYSFLKHYHPVCRIVI